jgi:general secretion pathway protein B
VLAAGGAGAAAQMWSRQAGTAATVQPVVAPPAASGRVAAVPVPADIEPLALSRSMENGVSRPAPSKRGQGSKIASGAWPQTAGQAELPVTLRQQLPQLAISGYILDKEAGSLAIIDGKVMRVGEEAAPGLRIEKIDTNGVTFNYQGYRFRR